MSESAVWTDLPLAFPSGGGGGGGGVTRYMTGYAPRVHKKRRKGVFFSHTAASTFSLKKGCLFILHRTLGVPRDKMLETLIQNAILGDLSHHHNN